MEGGGVHSLDNVFRGERGYVNMQITGHHWPASETPLKCRFAGGPMMA